jgi:hypothetical protein
MMAFMISTVDQGVLEVVEVLRVEVWPFQIQLNSYSPSRSATGTITPGQITEEMYTFLRTRYRDAATAKSLVFYQRSDSAYYRLTPQFDLVQNYEQVRAGQAGVRVQQLFIGRFPQELNINLSRVTATGLALQAERYRTVRDLIEGTLHTDLFTESVSGTPSMIFRVKLRHGGAKLES